MDGAPPLKAAAAAAVAATVEAAAVTHPALTALQAALNSADHLEPCLCALTGAAEGSSSAAAAASCVVAEVYERHWSALTKQLRLLVDATHPDAEGLKAESGNSPSAAKKGLPRPQLVDGRAVLLAWEVAASTSPLAVSEPASTSPHHPSQQQQQQQSCVGGAVTRLFHFLFRLACGVSRDRTTATAIGSSSSSAARRPAATKAELQAEDTVEPVLLYGCALASNLASLLSVGGRGERRNRHGKGVTDSTSTSAAAVAPTWTPEERESLAVLGNTAVWPLVLAVTCLYQSDKRMLHVLLSVVANMVSWPALKLDSDTAAFLYRLIFPCYTSTAMVAAWVTMLCNLTAVHGPVVVPTLLQLGAVADVQRLSLSVSSSESATAERLVVQSVQLLSNIATCIFQNEGEVE